LCQTGNLGQYVVERAGEFFAAGVRDDAVRAVFGTAFHNGNECRTAFYARRRQVVEFLDFGEGNIDLRETGGFFIYDEFGQAVQRLRAENHVHIRRAFDDVFAFLRGDAAGNADDEVGIFFFERTDTPQIGEDFFLRFFTHGTGVEQDDVGVVGLGNLLDAAVFFGKDGQHFFAVVLVHLATEGTDKYFFHGLCLSQAAVIAGLIVVGMKKFQTA